MSPVQPLCNALAMKEVAAWQVRNHVLSFVLPKENILV